MKKLIVLMIVLFSSSAIADEYVNGYTRNNGAYVAPHYRSSPDGSTYNNYSTQGNTNPYTGQAGTVAPSYGMQPIQPIQSIQPIQQYQAPQYGNFN